MLSRACGLPWPDVSCTLLALKLLLGAMLVVSLITLLFVSAFVAGDTYVNNEYVFALSRQPLPIERSYADLVLTISGARSAAEAHDVLSSKRVAWTHRAFVLCLWSENVAVRYRARTSDLSAAERYCRTYTALLERLKFLETRIDRVRPEAWSSELDVQAALLLRR